MTKLNQIIAVEKGVKAKTYRDISDLYKLLQKPQLMAGLSRSYTPKDDEGDQLPPESTEVQTSVAPLLDDLARLMSRGIDVTLTKDTTNMSAKADIKVGTLVLATGVPVSSLLYLEKQLADLHTELKALPTLDLSERWHYDAAAGVYATEATRTTRTKKVPRNHVKSPATDKHAAQVEMYFEDVIVGTWATVKYSGAITVDRKKQLIERTVALQEAVAYAREQANMIDVTDKKMGAALFDYLLAEE